MRREKVRSGRAPWERLLKLPKENSCPPRGLGEPLEAWGALARPLGDHS